MGSSSPWTTRVGWRQAVQPGQAAPSRGAGEPVQPGLRCRRAAAGASRARARAARAAGRRRCARRRCSSSLMSVYAVGRPNRTRTSGRPGTPKAPGPVDTRTSPAGRPARGRTWRAPGPRPRRGSPRGRGRGRRRPRRGLPPRTRRGAGRCRAGPAGRSRRCRAGRRRWCGTRRGSGSTGSNIGTWLHTPPMSSRGWPSPLTRTRVEGPSMTWVESATVIAPSRTAPGPPRWRCRRLPSRFGAGRSSPDLATRPVRPVRPPAAALLGRARRARRRRPAPATGPVRKWALGLPGGLTRCWMWPPPERTKVESPPNSWVERYAPCQGTRWSVSAPTM